MTRFSRKFYDGGEGGNGDQQQQQQQQQGATNLPQGAFMLDKYADALPDDLRSNPFVAQNPNLEAALRSGISARALIGKDPNSLIEIPKPGDADAFRGVMTKLGLPADAAKYTVDDKQLAEPFKMNTDFGKAVTAAAHKHGILPQSFQGFYSEVAGMLASTQQQTDREKATAREQGFAALQTEWGGAYDAKTAHARAAVEKLSPQGKGGEVMQRLIDAGLDADSGVMNLLANAGALVAEDSDVGGGGGNGGFGSTMTPAEANAKANELVAAADREKDLSKRRQLNDEAQKYFKIASGGKVIK